MKKYLPQNLNLLAPINVGDLIRLGSNQDGGYVISKNSIHTADFLLSFGLSDNWSFDLAFLKIHPDSGIHAYDHTVSERIFYRRFRSALIKTLRGKFSQIEHMKKGWVTYKNYRSFFKGNVKHFIECVNDKNIGPGLATIESIMDRTKSNKIFLKMDIEGSEYRVIQTLMKYSDRLVGMAIEFHDTDHLRATFLENIKVIQEKFSIVHIHPNNWGQIASDGLPDVLEISFVKNSSDLNLSGKNYITSLPLKNLDAPCNPQTADYSLDFDLT